MDDLRRGMQDLAKGVARAARATADAAVRAEGADDRNVVVAANVGRAGAVRGVSKTQVTRVRQRGGKTVRETTTTTREIEG